MIAIKFYHNLEQRANLQGPFKSAVVVGDSLFVNTQQIDERKLAEREPGGFWQFVEKRPLGGGSPYFRYVKMPGMYYTSFEIFAHEED